MSTTHRSIRTGSGAFPLGHAWVPYCHGMPLHESDGSPRLCPSRAAALAIVGRRSGRLRRRLVDRSRPGR